MLPRRIIMSDQYKKTAVAAASIGVAESYLISLLRRKAIDAPDKDTSGDYLWTPADIAAAKGKVDEAQRTRDEWQRQREEKKLRANAWHEKRAAKKAVNVKGDPATER